MRKSRRLIVFFLLLFLGTSNYVHTAVYYAFNGESSASITSPDVYLEQGTAGTSVVYPNATSAASQVDSHATTFYPNDYNVTQGVYVSGATPSDVSDVDGAYFIVNSSGSDTTAASYYPSSYNVLGGTSHIGGSLGNLTSDDGVRMVFQSHYYLNNTEDYVDNNVSNVDSVSNVGTFSDFAAQQNGPDAIMDTLSEEMVIISTIYDYIDTNTSDVDSITGRGTHTNFTAQKVGPDSVFDTLTEENMVVPTTVYDGTFLGATQTETSRKVFRNPRGLMHYYTFFLNKSATGLDLVYCNSSDGSVWSYPTVVSSTTGFNVTSYSVDYMEDPASQGLSVYLAFTAADNSNDMGSLLFRSGFIYDNSGTITFNSTQRLRNGSTKSQYNKAVITRGKNNYLWIICEYTADTLKKDFDILCTWSGSAAPALSPSFGTPVDVDKSSTWPEEQYITAVPLTGALGDVGIIWNFNNTVLKAVYGNYTGGAPDFGTIRNLNANLDYFLVSSVTDETTNDVHILYKDGTALKHVNWTVGTGFGTPDTVYSGSVDSLSISVDRTSSPNNLYAFYVHNAANSISYKNTTVDSINWSTEQQIIDTEGIDYISASRVDSNNDRIIQLVYTTDTNKLVRFVDRQAKYEIDLEEQATNVSTKEDVTQLCIYAGATDTENLGVNIWNTTSSAWDTLVNDVTINGWTNITITNYVASTLTFQFKGGTESQDIKLDSWQIDAVLLYQYNYTYQLDVEVQWTDLIHDRVNEYICINGGSMGAEDILVDIWYNSTWNNVISDLSAGWNNVSINTYLDSSTFTLRFRGGDEAQEYIQSSWEIDASLLHLWSDEQVTEVELEGSSNLYSWTQLEWLLDTSWTTDSVKVLFQLYNYNSMAYPSSSDGHIRYTSGTADVDETKSQVITMNPEYYRNGTGWWKVKIRGVKVTGVQYNLGIDQCYLQSTYYSEYSAQTEYIFTDVTDNQSPNLNFTVVSHNSIDGATVTLQVWNYTSSSFPSSGMGYLSYISTGANNTRWLNITNNAQSCLSGSYTRIRVTSVYSTTDIYQQLTNFVRLLQEESTLVNDYTLRVTNSGADLYTVRLVRLSDSNIDRIINCTIYLSSGETQLQVIDGAFTQTTGTWANLPAASSLDMVIEVSTVHLQYASVIDAELEVLRDGTSTYTKLPIQFTIT
jgi:hypothetical protein